MLQRLLLPDREEPFRVYAGYAGWAPGQLEMEVDRGDWHIVPGTGELVFSERLSELWRGLLPRRGTDWTKLRGPRPDAATAGRDR